MNHKTNIFAQSMTGNPYFSLPADLQVECTMNIGWKLQLGWKHLMKNEDALLVSL